MTRTLDNSSIAIVRLSAIGDVVHTLPLAASLRAAAPGAWITWVVQDPPYSLVHGNPWVDEFAVVERRPLAKGLMRLRREMAGRAFDLVLDPQTALKAGFVTGLLQAPRKIGYDRDRAPEGNWLFTNERIAARPRAHVFDEVLELIDHLGIPRVLEWGLESTPEERARFGPLLADSRQPTVALGLSSSRREKDWPADRFAELAARLVEDDDARILLVGGLSETEDRAAERVGDRVGDRALDLRAWDLRRLAYLLERADVYVGPDSGPLHIAVALGTPSVALMGYTNPKRVGPIRFRELMVDAFGDPGETYTAAARPRPGRMDRITVAEVQEKVRVALELAAAPTRRSPFVYSGIRPV